MKVTREEGFKPITIVLETKEEADCMLKSLNDLSAPFRKDENIRKYSSIRDFMFTTLIAEHKG